MKTPSKITLHKQSRTLEVAFGETIYTLSAEFLRTHSPSAEVRGHGHGQETLVVGKINVGITAVKPSGNYALQIIFDDGHDSGIFSWTYLHQLGRDEQALWQTYLNKLKAEKKNRDPHMAVIQFPPA